MMDNMYPTTVDQGILVIQEGAKGNLAYVLEGKIGGGKKRRNSSNLTLSTWIIMRRDGSKTSVLPLT